MQLEAAQRPHVEQWLKERRVRQCPTCGLHDFDIGDLTAVPTMVQVICRNCTYVLLFDTKALGLRNSV